MFWIYRCTQHNSQISAAGRAVAGLANGRTVAPSTTRVIHRLWRSAAGPCTPRHPITDDTGQPAGQTTWDYLPDAVRGAVADLKNVLLSGQFADAKIVKIQNLQVVNAEPGATVNVNSRVDTVLPPLMQALNSGRRACRT